MHPRHRRFFKKAGVPVDVREQLVADGQYHDVDRNRWYFWNCYEVGKHRLRQVYWIQYPMGWDRHDVPVFDEPERYFHYRYFDHHFNTRTGCFIMKDGTQVPGLVEHGVHIQSNNKAIKIFWFF